MPTEAKQEVTLNTGSLRDAVKLGIAISAPNGPHETLKVPYAVIPQDSKIESLLSLAYPHGLPPEKPHHIKAKVSLSDAASFCRYVALYADSRTRIFADPAALGFNAVLDYHGAPSVQITDGSDQPAAAVLPQAEFRDHQAVLALKTSEQWNIWTGRAEKEIPQAEFAEFIEDNYRDIVFPSAAEMLEVARSLTAHVDVNFASKVNSRNGTTQFAYTEVLTTGQPGQSGNLEVPEKFGIQIPVLFGEKTVQVEARLRFRINGGKLKFLYKLYRPTEILADAFNLTVSDISKKLSIEVLLGSI